MWSPRWHVVAPVARGRPGGTWSPRWHVVAPVATWSPRWHVVAPIPAGDHRCGLSTSPDRHPVSAVRSAPHEKRWAWRSPRARSSAQSAGSLSSRRIAAASAAGSVVSVSSAASAVTSGRLAAAPQISGTPQASASSGRQPKALIARGVAEERGPAVERGQIRFWQRPEPADRVAEAKPRRQRLRLGIARVPTARPPPAPQASHRAGPRLPLELPDSYAACWSRRIARSAPAAGSARAAARWPPLAAARSGDRRPAA